MKLLLLLAGLIAGACYAFYYGLRAWHKSRLLEDTPTSRVRSAVQGYLELAGRGEPLPNSQNLGPLTGIPCTWWRFKIEKKDSPGHSRSWSTLHSGTSEQPFLLDDGTGQCLVDPRGAEVYPAETSVWYGAHEWPHDGGFAGGGFFGKLAGGLVTDRYRYTEQRLVMHEIVRGIGAFRSLRSEENLEGGVSELLREWKHDQADLLQRFDENRDGVLGADEWERARAAAREQILNQLAAAPVAPQLDTLSKPADGRPFMLSSFDQGSLARRLRARALAGMAGFIGGATATAWIIVHAW